MNGETKDPNPFMGHNLSALVANDGSDDDDDETRGKLPFTDDELKAIFSYPELLKDKQFCFIAMLLLTSGARPNEICQLWSDDVAEIDGINALRIAANKKRRQTPKTPHSRRVIYGNRLLEDAGFIAYVKSRGLGMLFDLKKN